MVVGSSLDIDLVKDIDRSSCDIVDIGIEGETLWKDSSLGQID